MDLYDLTPITGQTASDRRTALVFGHVVNRRLALSGAGSLILGALVGAGCSALVGPVGLVAGLVVGLLGAAIANLTSSRGLKLRLWRSLYNKARSNNGRPMRVHGRVDVADPKPMRLVSSLSPEPVNINR